DPVQVKESIQYDYCDAYLDFYLEQPESAKRKAERWVNYPVPHWRIRFESLIKQTDEILGHSAAALQSKPKLVDSDSVALMSAFSFEIEDGVIQLKSQGLKNAKLNFYEMDVELMFSNQPFDNAELGGFAVVSPRKSISLQLDDELRKIKIPTEFAKSNILVEIQAGDQVKSKPYFANSISVQLVERFGQLLVFESDASKPVRKAYVKVYSKHQNGTIRFHKDGYTDMRGRFDYVSQSNNPLDGIEEYAILVLSSEFGAQTQIANSPAE
ncbi:MAG: hypothetical protein AAGA30_18835, partial [Planctomycetota bacterium]